MFRLVLLCTLWAHVFSSESSENLAKCRAHCLLKMNEYQSCQRDCQLCWKGCLQAEINLRDYPQKVSYKPCAKIQCRIGYKYYKSINGQERQRKVLAKWNSGLVYSRGQFMWKGFKNKYPVVYIVQLYAKNNTLLKDAQVVVPFYRGFDFMQNIDWLRITAVDETTILATKSIAMKTLLKTGDDLHEELQKNVINTLPWELQLVSLREEDEGNSVEADLEWAPQPLQEMKRYLVTWEVVQEEFGVKGHLYTDMNRTSLSLWPNSSYKILVEAVDSEDKAYRSSQPLYLDTHLIVDPPMSSTLLQPVSLTEESSNWQIIAGGIAGTALILFLMLHAMVIRSKTKSKSGILQTSADLDCEGGDLDSLKKNNTQERADKHLSSPARYFKVPGFLRHSKDGSLVSDAFTKCHIMFSPHIPISGIKNSKIHDVRIAS